MSFNSEIDKMVKLLKMHINATAKATMRWATCEAVDWENKTMTAVDENGLPYYSVLLGGNSAAIKPKIGADCLIAIVNNEETTTFLICADEVELMEMASDKIVFNGGELGGLVLAGELKTQLDKLTARVDGIIKAIRESAVVASDGGAAFKLNMTTVLKTLTNKEDFSNLENDKIKQ